MKILFYGNTLNYRGTTTAIRDYALYNQEVLGNESFISYDKTIAYRKDFGNEANVINNFSKKFNVYSTDGKNLNQIIKNNQIDVAYFIIGGGKTPITTQEYDCKTAIHAVFQSKDVHGDSYAYISKWLSEKMSNGKTPYVPHIVKLPKPTKNLRKKLNIPKNATILGRIGGSTTFDISYIKNAVQNTLQKNKDIYFLFIGTNKFINHERVIFHDQVFDLQEKANLINTCDAMIHARRQGESFGLSIAEFLYFNKPVIAQNGGEDRNHLDMLKNSNLLYNNQEEAVNMMVNIKDYIHQEVWRTRVLKYNPKFVMEKFNKVFLKN